MRELRILVADDHALIRRGVCDLLAARANWRVVGEASDGVEAVEQAERLRPDVAILDFSMPRMNGPAAAALIARMTPPTRVVILTMHDSDVVIQEVFKAGALGIVFKTDAVGSLLKAVEAVSESQYFFPPTSRLSLPSMLKAGSASALWRKSRVLELTRREREIMRLLAHGMTSRAAAIELRISTRTVETHRVNINRKLGLHSVADLVRYAMMNGIMLSASES